MNFLTRIWHKISKSKLPDHWVFDHLLSGLVSLLVMLLIYFIFDRF